MNVFVTDLTVEYVVTHVQGCSGFPCTVNMQHSVRSTIVSDLYLHKMSKLIQKLSSQ